jgi:hypothetical protein
LRFVGWRAAKKHRSLWRTNRGAVARPRCFDYLGFRSFFAEIFGRHQQPDDGGANSAPPSCFSAPLQNTLDDLRADDDPAFFGNFF